MNGNLLRDLRLAKGWSQEQLAYIVGTTRNTIYNIEHGKQNTTNDALATKIAKTLGTTVEELIGRKDA